MIQINGLKTNQIQSLLGLAKKYQRLEKKEKLESQLPSCEEFVRMLKKITKYCLEVKKSGK